MIFLLILVMVGLIYNYHKIAFHKLVGIHVWRNSVSAAFPVNYFYGGNFLTPQTNALPDVYHSIWTKALIGIVMLLLIMHCNGWMHYRNSERDPYFVESSEVVKMYDIEDYLDEIGVDRTCKVYCTPYKDVENLDEIMGKKIGQIGGTEIFRLNTKEKI